MGILWAYIQFRVIVWLLRMTGRLLLFATLAALLVAAAPITVVTAVTLAGAWLRGWPPARLYRAAAWSLPVTAAWLITLEIRVPGFLAARDPRRTWAGGAAEMPRVVRAVTRGDRRSVAPFSNSSR